MDMIIKYIHIHKFKQWYLWKINSLYF